MLVNSAQGGRDQQERVCLTKWKAFTKGIKCFWYSSLRFKAVSFLYTQVNILEISWFRHKCTYSSFKSSCLTKSQQEPPRHRSQTDAAHCAAGLVFFSKSFPLSYLKFCSQYWVWSMPSHPLLFLTLGTSTEIFIWEVNFSILLIHFWLIYDF